MSAVLYLQTFALLLLALGAATVAEPLVSKHATSHRLLLLGFVGLAVPVALLALLLFGLRVLLD